MVSNFPKLVKSLLGELPDDDYPVLNTFLFVSTWLNFALDQSQTSMRSLFKRLNVRGINVHISTFSKASQKRDPLQFYNLFLKLRKKLKKSQKQQSEQLSLFPLDSTIVTAARGHSHAPDFKSGERVTLTSKLLWSKGFHQVKLFAGLNLLTAEPRGILIHFGQGHDSKYGDSTIESTP